MLFDLVNAVVTLVSQINNDNGKTKGVLMYKNNDHKGQDVKNVLHENQNKKVVLDKDENKKKETGKSEESEDDPRRSKSAECGCKYF